MFVSSTKFNLVCFFHISVIMFVKYSVYVPTNPLIEKHMSKMVNIYKGEGCWPLMKNLKKFIVKGHLVSFQKIKNTS